MTEDEGKKFVSIGMMAAFSDMADKIGSKIAMLEKAKTVFPQHADYYESVIEMYSDEYEYAKNMALTGRQMHGSTIQ